MVKLQLTVLTRTDVERRYANLKGTRIAQLTNEAILEGYSIGMLHYTGLNKDTPRGWYDSANSVVADHFKGQRYKIGIFTDLSEVKKDNLYFSFKLKNGIQIAHSLSGCDSEGFIYNC